MREDQIEIVHNSAIEESLAFELCKPSQTLNETSELNPKCFWLMPHTIYAVNLAKSLRL
jgi:hypothetical protein